MLTCLDGNLIINGQDSYRRRTRAFYFDAAVPGNYALVIGDLYKPGGKASLPGQLNMQMQNV